MKKLLQIFLILIITLAFSMNLSVFAVNTTDTNTTDSITNTATDNTQTSAQQNNVNTPSTSSSTTTQVSSVSSANEGELSISDILNILLIATGVVIILLAIAILTRLK